MTEEFKIAAKWWADCLRNRISHETGDPSTDMLFTMLVGDIRPLPQPTVDLFEELLFKILMADAEFLKPDGTVVLECDYGPDRRIREAASACGFDVKLRFPVKTYMIIRRHFVEVRCGYSAMPLYLHGEISNSETRSNV